jgi:ABC-type oligopeptide transport system ATPase subunit
MWNQVDDAIAAKPEDHIILEVKNLKMYFPIYRGLLQKVVGYVKAVDDVSFALRAEVWGCG